MHQRNAPSQETFSLLSTRKLKTLFLKYKLELTTGIHACIDLAFANIRDSWQPRKRRMKSEFTFFSLYRDYSNSLTLSNANELFWSRISVNHIKVHKEKENFVIACLRPSQNMKLAVKFSRAVMAKKCTKKRDVRAKLLFSLVKLLLFYRLGAAAP